MAFAMATLDIPLRVDTPSTSIFRISFVAMTGAAITIDDASAADTIRSVKERVFAANRKLPTRRQRLVYRPGLRGIEPLADDETLGGAGVARDGSAELDVLLADLTAAEVADLGPRFLKAAEEGRASDMLELLDEGADIEFSEFHGVVALIRAAVRGHADCVRLLLDAGAGKDAKDHDDFSALICAAVRGHTDCVRLLLDAGVDKEAKDVCGRTALMWAARKGHTDCVRVLMDSGADKELEDQDGHTASDMARFKGHVDVARLIASYDASLEEAEINQEEEHSVLSAAAASIFRISVVAMTGAAITIDDASAADTIRSVKERVFAANRKLPVHRQRLMYRSGPHGMNPLPDDETLGGAGVARDGSAELDVLLADLTAAEVADLGLKLLKAAREGRASDMLELLDEGASVDFTDDEESTALQWAAAMGKSDCVRLLLDAGADKEFKDCDEWTALIFAANSGHVDCVRLLLDAGADLEALDEYGRTPLIFAVRKSREDCVRALLDAGASTEAKNEDGNTALQMAHRIGNADIACMIAGKTGIKQELLPKILLATGAETAVTAAAMLAAPLGADLESTSTFRISIFAMSGAAITIDDASAADTIRSVKERVFAANRKLPTRRQRLVYRPGLRGIEPLADDETLGGAGVARDGSAELDVLLADLTAAEVADLGPRFLKAAEEGRASDMLELLDEGAGIDFVDDDGVAALMWAAMNGHPDCVRLALDAGADTEANFNEDWTALVCAAISGHADCARLLLDAGADAEAKGQSGRTALMWASRNGHADCAKALLDGGANMNSVDCGKITALIYAAQNDHMDCVRMLLDAGADKDAMDEDGHTASRVAELNGCADLAHFISSYSSISPADNQSNQEER